MLYHLFQSLHFSSRPNSIYSLRYPFESSKNQCAILHVYVQSSSSKCNLCTSNSIRSVGHVKLYLWPICAIQQIRQIHQFYFHLLSVEQLHLLQLCRCIIIRDVKGMFIVLRLFSPFVPDFTHFDFPSWSSNFLALLLFCLAFNIFWM